MTIPFDKIGFNKDGKINGTVNDTVNGKINGKINGNINYSELSHIEASVLNTIIENNQLTIPLISEQTGLSQRNVSRALDLLKNKGIIERVGSRKTGHWKIVKKAKKIRIILY